MKSRPACGALPTPSLWRYRLFGRCNPGVDYGESPFYVSSYDPPGFLPPVFSAIAKHAPCLAAWGQSGGQRKGKEAHLTIDVWFPDGYGEMQYDITWSPIRGPLGRG